MASTDSTGVESTESADDRMRAGLTRSGEVSKLIDWLTVATLLLGGVVLAALGIGMYALADRDRIADWVADGTLQSEGLSDPELVDATHAFLTWGGVGLVLTGLLLLVGGIAFLFYRRRVRRQPTAGHPDSITLAIIGAVVTVLTSFVPFSPVVGGMTAGYLRGGETRAGVRVGAYAGVVAAFPAVVVTLCVIGGLVGAGVELGFGSAGVFLGVALVLSVVVSGVYLVGLSAIGGYIGVLIAEDEQLL